MTERGRTKDELAAAREPAAHAPELLDALLRGTRDGVALISHAGELLSWNTSAAAITGWTLADAVKNNFADIARSAGALTEIRSGKWIEVRRFAIGQPEAPFTLVVFTDSTPQLRLRDVHRQFRALGLLDDVTGLPGRELAMVHVDHAIALARRDKRSVGLLALRLDRFRELRAETDKPALDETVRQFAKRVTAFVRASDVPARIAEDTFLVVLSAMTSPSDGVVVAVRLLLALAEPFDVVGQIRTLHCSIGVAEAPRDAERSPDLLGAALGAADRAQLEGGGQYVVAGDGSGSPR